MIHTTTDDCSFLELQGNEISVVTFMTDCSDEKEEAFIKNLSLDYMNNETEEVGFKISIKLSDILNSSIEGHKLVNEKNEQLLDIESKPLFDNTKAELLTLIAKIDSLKFK